jgi:uncharacterized protein YdcH (DUF465 family)
VWALAHRWQGAHRPSYPITPRLGAARSSASRRRFTKGDPMFPEYRDLITSLKHTDLHFRRLFDQHNDLDQKVKNMEDGIEMATPAEIDTLKRGCAQGRAVRCTQNSQRRLISPIHTALHSSVEQGAKPQTVLQHGKAEQRSYTFEGEAVSGFQPFQEGLWPP